MRRRVGVGVSLGRQEPDKATVRRTISRLPAPLLPLLSLSYLRVSSVNLPFLLSHAVLVSERARRRAREQGRSSQHSFLSRFPFRDRIFGLEKMILHERRVRVTVKESGRREEERRRGEEEKGRRKRLISCLLSQTRAHTLPASLDQSTCVHLCVSPREEQQQ